MGALERRAIPTREVRADLVRAAEEVQNRFIWIGLQADLLVRQNELGQLQVEEGEVGSDRRNPAACPNYSGVQHRATTVDRW